MITQRWSQPACQAAPDRVIEPHRIGGCRRELLDRTLVWNQAHLRQILRQYEIHHNQHRPHRSLYGAAPLKPLPEPVDLDLYRARRQAHVSGLINEYHRHCCVERLRDHDAVNSPAKRAPGARRGGHNRPSGGRQAPVDERSSCPMIMRSLNATAPSQLSTCLASMGLAVKATSTQGLLRLLRAGFLKLAWDGQVRSD
jgi:hypothetical protein